MNIIYNKIFLTHQTGDHPENPRRLNSFGELKETDIPGGEELLRLIHTEDYIKRVKDASASSEKLDPETIISHGSYECAVKAASAAVLASETNGFALVRPPGHHAFSDHPAGFCIFNNIAIAAQKLVNYGKRVLIFDFDGHLGDGTEFIFYKTNKVLYWSIHQYPAYPGGGEIGQIGEGEGKGFTINVPILPGSGDDVYLRAVDVVLPVVKQYNPDIIGFSAGFDGSQHDPLLRLRLSYNLYYDIGKRFHDLNIPSFAVLEGGYNTESLPKCLYNFLAGINGINKPYEEDGTDTKFLELEQFEETLAELKEKLSPYWKL